MTTPAIAAPFVDLYIDILANGGATWHAYRPAPSDGFMVSVPNHERTVPLAEFSGASVATYVADKRDSTDLFEDLYFGAWVDGDLVYFDLSLRVETLKEATALGSLSGQLAVFDVANLTEIRL